MLRSEIYRATVTVALFWWGALTLYSVFGEGQGWLASFYSWKYIVFGVVFATATTVGVIVLILKNRTGLIAESKSPIPRGMGMKCTIGPTPAWLRSPTMVDKESIPKIPNQLAVAIQNAAKKDVCYQKIATDILRILAKYPKAPASPYTEGHGNETLLEHTLNVTMKAISEAPKYEYKGLYGISGRLVVGLRDSKYVFDSSDPLIILAALAHDIGKLDSYIVKDRKIVGMRRNHDTMSMLLLGRLESVWKLPSADRSALLGAVGYYHAPQTLPLDSAGRARDDRTIALLELLRRCDIEASGEEDGAEAFKEILQTQIKTTQNKVLEDEDIWNAFVSLVQEPGRVNGQSNASVGQKWDTNIIFNEDRVRKAMLSILGIPDPGRRGDGTYILTVKLMAILMNRDLLVNTFQGREYGPTRAIFEVNFSDPDSGKQVAHWNACFIVHPDDQLSFLAQMRSHKAIATIVRPVMGEHSARNKNGAKGESKDEPKEQKDSLTLGESGKVELPDSGSPFPSVATQPVTTKEVAPADTSSTHQTESESPFPSAVQEPEVVEQSASPFPPASVIDELVQPALVADESSIKQIVQSEAPTEFPIDNTEASPFLSFTPEAKVVDETPPDDDDSAMHALHDPIKEEVEAQSKRDQYSEEKRKTLQAERESKLPSDQKAKLNRFDLAIASDAPLILLNQTHKPLASKKVKRSTKPLDEQVVEARKFILDHWYKHQGKAGGSFVLGANNKENLYVMKTWLDHNASQFNWDELAKQGFITSIDTPEQKTFLLFVIS